MKSKNDESNDQKRQFLRRYIEFAGVHTAGKTTLLNLIVDTDALAPLLASYPQKMKRSKLSFATHIFISVFTKYRDLIFVVSFFLKYAKLNWENYRVVGRFLLKMVILHDFYKRFEFDVWLKDDMLHLLPRIQFRDKVDIYEAFLKYFLHFKDIYTGIIYMHLDEELMQARFESRFSNRPKHRKISRKPLYSRVFRQNKILQKVLHNQQEIPVLFLDGSHSISSNSKRAVHFIQSLVNR